MLQSPPANASFAFGTLERARAHEEDVEQAVPRRGSPARTNPSFGQRELARQLSLAFAYELWLGSWETALSALTTATQSRTLSTNEAATHKAMIAAEAKVVTNQFTILLGHHRTRRGARDEVPAGRSTGGNAAGGQRSTLASLVPQKEER